jgi:peptide/nickel transport system permease protein
VIRAALIRTLELALVGFGVSVLTFLMIHLVPGDAAQLMLGAADATPERIAALRHTLGLDRSLVAQYGIWIGHVLQGDFGTSVWTGRPVLGESPAAFRSPSNSPASACWWHSCSRCPRAA